MKIRTLISSTLLAASLGLGVSVPAQAHDGLFALWRHNHHAHERYDNDDWLHSRIFRGHEKRHDERHRDRYAWHHRDNDRHHHDRHDRRDWDRHDRRDWDRHDRDRDRDRDHDRDRDRHRDGDRSYRR